MKTITATEQQYFYHPDHLGSFSFITDASGDAHQHSLCRSMFCPLVQGFTRSRNGNKTRIGMQYLPYGEDFISQRIDWQTRYTFSAKEKDKNTGYHYFGARYYDSEVSVWLSVDPLADKYPGMSPYMYTAGNPVMLVDPNGMETIARRDEWEVNIDNGSVNWKSDKGGTNKQHITYVDKYGKRIPMGQSIEGVGFNIAENNMATKDLNGRLWHKYNSKESDIHNIAMNCNASSQGGHLSLARLYTHFQVGGGKPLDINMSSVDFGGATQRDLGLIGMEAGDIRGVQLFRRNSLTIAGLAFGRVRMMAHGNNQFSIISDESARFDFAPLIDRTSTLERNVGNVIGASINYDVFLMPSTPLAPVVPLIFGGPFDVNFHGTTTIPR